MELTIKMGLHLDFHIKQGKKFDDKKNKQIMTKKRDLISLYTYNILPLYFNKNTNFDDD